MSDLRKEFEKNELIAEYVRMYCVFDSDSEDYNPKNRFNSIHDVRCEFVNGAWFMFQEKQKQIDAVLKITNEYWLDDDRDYHVYIQRIEEALK